MPDSDAPLGPVDATSVPRFAGPATFARLPRLDEADPAALRDGIAILGAPFDAGTSYRPGARFGPGHIRGASKLLRPFHPALGVEPFAAQQVVDAGDLALNPFDIPAALTAVQTGVSALRRMGLRVVTLGGDHTIALPILRSLATDGGPVAVVHFDAHLDTWDTYFGAPFTHGTPFRRAAEEGLLDLNRCVHVGTRGPLYSDHDLSDDETLGFQVIPADRYETGGVAEVASAISRRLGDRPVYVSVDVDVLDPAHAPGTGTPEAGGLTSRELLGTVRALAGRRLLGADVVEVAPAYDHAEITGIAAAHIVYELLAVMSAA
ncbi:agmatinase [Gordonia neofelifaecis]|uniref:Agmatinase n=1 Tax=Gordonia neofelifaecis NRRL B-59395 TaxID=644548 RepID=F1YGW5_9ACTN|nr:agmatinase [Gordonia neofelifaecis]EGD56263.1 agmatinase [Gordonia neofelifaecis NRRL B-59395]